MVHVPFLGIDLPEPRLVHVIPDTVNALVICTSRALEEAHYLLSPASADDVKSHNEAFEKAMPREYDRVRKRYAEGKIVNSEQLSSELEDASFDWYRRMLRTDVIGATDEQQEDLSARKLGLRRPSTQQAVLQQHLEQQAEAAGGVSLGTLFEEEAARQQLEAEEDALRQQLQARANNVRQLRHGVRPAQRQALSTLTSASGGALAGVFIFKMVTLLARKVFRKRGRSRTSAALPGQRQPKTPNPRLSDVSHAPSVASTAAATGASQPQATPRSARRGTASRLPAATTADSKGNEGKAGAADAKPAAAAKARPGTKRR